MSVKTTSAQLRAAKIAAQKTAAAQPVLVQSPAAAPQPVSQPAATPPAVTVKLHTVRTLADVLAEIDKVSEAATLARKVGFADIAQAADKRLDDLHAEKAALSPAPAAVSAPRQSAVKVEDVTPPAPVAVLSNVFCKLTDETGRTLGLFTAGGKNFQTGSRGYYANGKVEIGGKRYQVQVQLVEIGSKPAADSK